MALFNKKNKKASTDQPVPVTEAVKVVLPKGEDARAYQAIIRPHQTEKAAHLNTLNQYTFRVAKVTNKLEIKRAVEKLYKVKVAKVAVINLPAKVRRLGRQIGSRPGFKKAIITLRAGDKIDLAA